MTNTEKNDIIALEILGWHKAVTVYVYYYGSRTCAAYFDSEGKAKALCGVDGFNPCESLDDCHRAEEAMSGSLQADYFKKLTRIVCGDASRYAYKLSERGQFLLVHATPEQKVNAMLKALEEAI